MTRASYDSLEDELDENPYDELYVTMAHDGFLLLRETGETNQSGERSAASTTDEQIESEWGEPEDEWLWRWRRCSRKSASTSSFFERREDEGTSSKSRDSRDRQL